VTHHFKENLMLILNSQSTLFKNKPFRRYEWKTTTIWSPKRYKTGLFLKFSRKNQENERQIAVETQYYQNIVRSLARKNLFPQIIIFW